MRICKALAVSLSLAALTGAAQAELVNRGGGMIYDNTRNITWLADMNYAKTSGYAGADAEGLMNWDAAKLWADNLSYGGYSDWRLPTLNAHDTSCNNVLDNGGRFPNHFFGYNCTGGELSGLFVTDLGYNNNTVDFSNMDPGRLITSDDTAEQIANLALFRNVQSSVYWSGVEAAPNQNTAWLFGTSYGFQIFEYKNSELYAVAVRPGDVAAAVPEPQTWTLMLLGLTGVLLACRRRAL